MPEDTPRSTPSAGPKRVPSVRAGPNVSFNRVENIGDEFLVVLAGLMEGGQKDKGAAQTLAALTQLLSREDDRVPPTGPQLAKKLDEDCFDTLMSYCDMRQDSVVRGHGTMALSAYLKAAQEQGIKQLKAFFYRRVKKGTYDDYIMAFSAASCTFPLVPDTSAELFLSEGFVCSLGPLMKREWKSRKVEYACLDMLNTACMNAKCRESIKEHCTEWLDDVVSEEVPNEEIKEEEMGLTGKDDPMQQRLHTPIVKNLAAVVLAKLQSTPAAPSDSKIQVATTDMDELADRFTHNLTMKEETIRQSSIEGLAYASLCPQIKEKLVSSPEFLRNLVQFMQNAQAMSPSTYGALVILVNLTSYLPRLDEKQKKITELRNYASGAKMSPYEDPLNLAPHVDERCRAVFKAGIVPVLASHSFAGSVNSLKLVASILLSLSSLKDLRGRLVQEGAVKCLLFCFQKLPAEDKEGKKIAAQALARILISTNPIHVFGGSNPHPLHSAIPPLVELLHLDPDSEYRDMLLPFEGLLALTNLASIEDDAKAAIVRQAWEQIDELVLNSNTYVSRAATELICNLIIEPSAVAKFCDGTAKAKERLLVLLALTDSQDAGTRLAAGGAVAQLTQYDVGVNSVLELADYKGAKFIVKMLSGEEEEMRHRGAMCVLNCLEAPGDAGKKGLIEMKETEAAEALKDCLKQSKSQEVIEICVHALKHLTGGGKLLTEAASAT